jgi:hypothetical protein
MRLPRLTWGGLDLGDHLVVGDRRLANEVARILRVQDHRVDVVAGEGADRVDRVPRALAFSRYVRLVG